MTGTLCHHCDTPTAGAWLCDKCTHTLAYALANIAAYHDDLDTIAAKQARYGTTTQTKGSVGKTQPLPADMRFLGTIGAGTQLRYDTWATIVAWCRIVMDEQAQVAGPVCRDCLHPTCHTVKLRRWPTGHTIRDLCLYLDRMHRWVEARDWAPVLLDELLDLERRLKRMIDRPADRWYAGRCSATDDLASQLRQCTAELYASADRGVITCPACGTRHDVAERRDFLLAEAKDYLVTATEAAGALLAWTDYDGSESRLIKRISEWRDRGRLEVRDVTSLLGRDRHLYRLGDIQDLLVVHAQRVQSRVIGVA